MLADAHITFVYCTDLDRSAAFYGDVLGLPMVLDQGSCRIYRAAAAAYVGVCRRLDRTVSPEGIILTLVTDDVDGWFTQLAAAGAAFEHAPRSNPEYGIYHTFLRDPDGYLIEIQRFDNAGWASAP